MVGRQTLLSQKATTNTPAINPLITHLTHPINALLTHTITKLLIHPLSTHPINPLLTPPIKHYYHHTTGSTNVVTKTITIIATYPLPNTTVRFTILNHPDLTVPIQKCNGLNCPIAVTIASLSCPLQGLTVYEQKTGMFLYASIHVSVTNVIPTMFPTGQPSQQPSTQPSRVPTTRPSLAPTKPSSQPSSEPSMQPSCEPSGD